MLVYVSLRVNTLLFIIMVQWKIGPFNISFLSFRVIFHFHDYGKKGIPSRKECRLGLKKISNNSKYEICRTPTVLKSGVHQLRLVVEIPLFTRFYLYIPGGWDLGFLNHQQYEMNIKNKKSLQSSCFS